MIMYKSIKPPFGENPNAVYRMSDNVFVQFFPDSKDYQEYLAWLAEGNTPLPADE